GPFALARRGRERPEHVLENAVHEVSSLPLIDERLLLRLLDVLDPGEPLAEEPKRAFGEALEHGGGERPVSETFLYRGGGDEAVPRRERALRPAAPRHPERLARKAPGGERARRPVRIAAPDG